MKISLFLSLITIAQLFMNSAYAIPYKGNKIYRAIDKEGNEIIIISDEPLLTVKVQAGIQTQIYTTKADDCGMLKIPDRFRNIISYKIGIKTTDVASLKTGNISKCIKGTGKTVSPINEDFRAPSGTIVVRGIQEGGSTVNVEITRYATRTLHMSMCGFAVLRPQKFQPAFTVIKIGETTYKVSELPNAGDPPRCLNEKTYIPAAWGSNL